MVEDPQNKEVSNVTPEKENTWQKKKYKMIVVQVEDQGSFFDQFSLRISGGWCSSSLLWSNNNSIF